MRILKSFSILAIFILTWGCKSKEEKKAPLSPAMTQQVLLEYNKRLQEHVNQEIEYFVQHSDEPYKKSDLGLYELILIKGDGDTLQNDVRVHADMVFSTIDSTSLRPVYTKNETFTVGKHSLAAINMALKGKQSGCEFSVIVPPQLGFGLKGDGNKIPPTRPFVIKVKILKDY